MNPLGGNSHPEAGGKDEPGASHRLTLDLARIESLATMIASSRASRVVELSDLLAGMYIHEWDRLSTYWDFDGQERMESFMRRICRISPQRWHYWIQTYDGLRSGGGRRKRLLPQALRKISKEIPLNPPLHYSAELIAVLKQAEEITPFRDTTEGRPIPVLTCECVLLSMARGRGSDVCRRLAASGLNVPLLERDALSPRRAPRG